MSGSNVYKLLVAQDFDGIVKAFQPLARARAQQFARRSGLPVDDLYSIALESIFTAARTFDCKYKHNGTSWIATKVKSDLRRICARTLERAAERPIDSLNVIVYDDEDSDGVELQDLIPDHRPTIEQEILDDERTQHIMDALDAALIQISPRQRLALQHYYLRNDCGASRQDIADRFGISIYTFNKLTFEARADLRRILTERYANVGEILND